MRQYFVITDWRWNYLDFYSHLPIKFWCFPLIYNKKFSISECEHNTLGPINVQLNEFNTSEDEEEYNDNTDVEEENEEEDDGSDEDVDVFYYPDDEPLEQVLEIPVSTKKFFFFKFLANFGKYLRKF